MLSKNEKSVMQYIYTKCHEKGTALLSGMDISTALYPNVDLNINEIDEIIKNLVLENYISVVNSDKNGREIYCITLNTKGKSFERDLQNQKKNVRNIIIRTVLVACLSFAVSMILKAIFALK